MDIGENPEIQSIWLEAKTHIDQGNLDKAIEIYKYILIRYSDQPDCIQYANAYLADLFLTLRELDKSKHHINQALSLNPSNPEFRYILGFIYTIEQRWDKAISELETAVASEPHNSEYHRALGWALSSKGNKDDGLKHLKKATTLDPSNANTFADLAACYLAMLDFPSALKNARKAVRLNPDNSIAQNLLTAVKTFGHAYDNAPDHITNTISLYENPNFQFIYRFKVSLRDLPDIWRIIDIKGTQRLSSLHKAILQAFNRSQDGDYSFFLSNKPYDTNSEYTSALAASTRNTKMARRLRIDSVELYGGRKFLYLFGYENECWHDVELIEVMEKVTRAKYPKVVKKQGKAHR
ncbi:MAG: tetratricopeptide repeat protein [Dehalococcoidales bacterium]|nr:tetratricopeptide repeat protein [Limnochordia bacterium]MDD2252527.1 tetratricopeptide repeat protein [Dehalococcoidales bacterium]